MSIKEIKAEIREEYARIIRLGEFNRVKEFVTLKKYQPFSIEPTQAELEELLEFCKTIN